MKNKFWYGGGAVVILIVLFFIISGNKTSETADIMVNAERGKFEVVITTTGELEAKNSVDILGPTGLRQFRIYNVNIQSIAEEGKQVQKGERIASLDPSELTNRMADLQSEVEEEEAQFIQIKLDTALQMREARNELINLEYAVEEREIILEQSKFEPPATIKQAEIDLEKAKRAFQQARENYQIKFQQNVARMREVAADLNKARREYKGIIELRDKFTIIAPESGMLIYRKGRDGKAIKEGSQISAWDPVVATLPDLSVMLSKTYVNEVDVRKIKEGQLVNVGLDAFPEKELTGRVIHVANVGEQRPNSDAKVFQVDVELDGSDPLLRPSMTTSNAIITNAMEDVLHVPLETLHSKDDSITYVYLKSGLDVLKQEVQVGMTNSDEAVILAGLEDGARLYLSVPVDQEDEPIDLLPELNGKRNLKEESPNEINVTAPEEISKTKRRRRPQ